MCTHAIYEEQYATINGISNRLLGKSLEEPKSDKSDYVSPEQCLTKIFPVLAYGKPLKLVSKTKNFEAEDWLLLKHLVN